MCDVGVSSGRGIMARVTGRLPYTWLEREARDEGKELLRGSEYIVDAATEALARTMQPLSIESVAVGLEPPEFWVRTAVLHMTAIGIRSARAAATLIRGGYAPESLPQLRQLTEAVYHVRWVLADSNGNRARNWLRDDRSRTTTATKIARANGTQQLFDALGKRLHVTQQAASAFRDDVDDTTRYPITVVPAHMVEESKALMFAISELLVQLADLLVEAFDLPSADESLADVRLVQRVDAGRHVAIEALLSRDDNPFRDLPSPAGSYI